MREWLVLIDGLGMICFRGRNHGKAFFLPASPTGTHFSVSLAMARKRNCPAHGISGGDSGEERPQSRWRPMTMPGQSAWETYRGIDHCAPEGVLFRVPRRVCLPALCDCCSMSYREATVTRIGVAGYWIFSKSARIRASGRHVGGFATVCE